MKRLNMANTSVQANLISMINRDCLLALEKNFKAIHTNSELELDIDNKKKLISLV